MCKGEIKCLLMFPNKLIKNHYIITIWTLPHAIKIVTVMSVHVTMHFCYIYFYINNKLLFYFHHLSIYY